MVDFVELNQMIVATEAHAHMWRVVNQIVGRAIADASERDGRLIDALHASVVVNVIILCQVFAPRERRPIATVE